MVSGRGLLAQDHVTFSEAEIRADQRVPSHTVT